MKIAGVSETFISVYRTKRRHVPENINIHVTFVFCLTDDIRFTMHWFYSGIYL
jgi:hypothetical protein